MYFREEVITPAKAKKYLSLNIPNNRTTSPITISTYASDIKEKLWISNSGDNIKFNTQGELIDGQQRLMAVIEANTTVTMWVAYDVSDEALPVIDTGRARTFAHTLKMQHAINTPRTSAIVKWIYLFDKGYPMNKGAAKPSHSQLNIIFKKSPTAFVEASRRADDVKRTGMAASGVAGVAYYLFNRISPSITYNFFDQLVSGANVPEKSPILTLRNRLFKVLQDRLTLPEVLALYIRAWNNYLEDKPVTMLYSNGTDKKKLNNSNFPQIKMPK